MGIFGNLLNSSEAQQFVSRYEQGAPANSYSDQEVAQRFQQVAPQLSQDQFLQAAVQAFQRMSPQERAQFAQYIEQQAQELGVGLPQGQAGGNLQDPSALAQMTTQVHQQQPGLLGQLLGGQSGQAQTWETLDPKTKELFIRTWGSRAQAEWEKENARAHSPLSNPVAKAALAGIAAMAMKHLLSNH